MRQPRKSSLSSKTMVDGETRASQPSLGSPHHCGVFLVQTLVAHMLEELKDASRVLPSAMMWGSVFSATLGMIMLITLCFCLGPDWQDTVLGLNTDTQTGIHVIQVLYNSTNSITGTTVMTTLLILLSLVGTITTVAASSRQVWAFARDKGLPSYIEHVSLEPPISTLLAILADVIHISPTRLGRPCQFPYSRASRIAPNHSAQLRLRRRAKCHHHQPI